MLEVLLLGVFVAYTKLGDLVTIELGPAVYALGLLTVVWVWAEVAFDPQAVWEEIERRGQTHAPMPVDPPLAWRPGAMGCEGCGLVCVPAETDGHCPRCGSMVHERKPNSVSRTWALVLAAIVLYIPANVYPVLTVMQLGAGSPAPSWAASRNCWIPACIRWPPWCSSPASWCRCSSFWGWAAC